MSTIYQRIMRMTEPTPPKRRGRARTGTVVQEDGSLRPDSYRVNDKGCIVWKFSMNGRTPQGFQRLPDGSYAQHNIRRFMWERAHPGETPPKRLTPSCGNKRCVNPDHAVPAKIVKEEKILALLQEGKTRHDVAQEVGCSLSTISHVTREHGITTERNPRLFGTAIRKAAQSFSNPEKPPRVDQRNWDIFLAAQSAPYATVGETYGLTRERVRQIFGQVLRDMFIHQQLKGQEKS